MEDIHISPHMLMLSALEETHRPGVTETQSQKVQPLNIWTQLKE